jgi:RND family efflux transporter MFP subunit
VELARANLVQGEAERDNAAVELRRAQELAATHFISSSALDSAQARYNKASASIAALQAQIGVASASLHAAQVGVDQTLIRAPFAGVVLTKNANVGDILTPFSNAAGTTGAVVTMADMASLEVEADVSESSIARISVGQPAEIQLDAFPELRLLGTVSRIVPDVDRSRATLLVKVRFDQPDPRVLPDMSARIAFLSRAPRADERQPVTALRPEAVVKRDGRDGRDAVFVVQAAGGGVADGASSANAANAPIAADPAAPPPDAGKAVLTAVRLGPKIGDLIQVDGVAAGTRVVIDPPPDLADGRSVAAARK